MKQETVKRIVDMLVSDKDMCSLAVVVFKEECKSREDFLELRREFFKRSWEWCSHLVACFIEMSSFSLTFRHES